MFSQPKVSYLDNPLRNEYILELQISMNKILELQFIQSLQNLFDILEHFWQVIIAGNQFLSQVILTILQNNENWTLVFDDIVNFNYVLGMERMQVFVLIIFSLFDLFSRDFLVSTQVHSLPHLRKTALSDQLFIHSEILFLKVYVVLYWPPIWTNIHTHHLTHLCSYRRHHVRRKCRKRIFAQTVL